MRVALLESDFDPWREVARFAESIPQGRFGATAVFVGTMRDFNGDEAVAEMLLDHYEGMTQKHLSDLAAEVAEQYQLTDLMMLHRVGKVVPSDPIVVVAAWSAHRAQAFAACERMVEDLKSKAPFWKKETLTGGRARWVEGNTASRKALYG